MRYFEELQTKSKTHKERFALLAAGTVTIFIFAFWSLTQFTPDKQYVEKSYEVGPLESLSASISGSVSALKESFLELQSTLNIYGG